jgi:hypothetical protein
VSFKFDRTQSKKKKCNANEKRLAKKHGGRRQPNSGALPSHRGDIKRADYLIDLKQTEKMSISVKLEDLVKIMREANGEGLSPALLIHFENAKNFPKDWVLIQMSDLGDES